MILEKCLSEDNQVLISISREDNKKQVTNILILFNNPNENLHTGGYF